MKTVMLTARIDNVTGSLGLACNGLPDLDDDAMTTLSGVVIAHDLIEHVNGVKHIGTIHDELQALGAVWFVRGQWGDLTRHARNGGTPYEILGRDVEMLAIKHVHNPVEILRTGGRKRVDHIQNNLLECINEARKAVKMHRYDAFSGISNTSEAIDALLEDFYEAAAKLMRQGYDKAARKYETGLHANTLFWSIVEAVEAERLIEENLEEGARYRLRYDQTGNNEHDVTFERVY